MALMCMRIRSGKIVIKVRARRVQTCGGLTQDRLHSMTTTTLLLPPTLVAYAWSAEKRVHISAACVLLLLIGFSSVYVPRPLAH
jgi:hypothetical protein